MLRSNLLSSLVSYEVDSVVKTVPEIYFFPHFLSPVASGTRTRDLGIAGTVIYHCAGTAGNQKCLTIIFDWPDRVFHNPFLIMSL